MLDTQLVIVTGMSGAGKSTMAQNLARQCRGNEIPHVWLHEEIKDHPIREGEFRIGSLLSEEDLERNFEDMFGRWERLVGQIVPSGQVYLMEGVLYQNIIRYFFNSRCSPERMAWYYDEVMARMAPARPVVVHLVRSDVRVTLEAMYVVRGTWWKNLILDEDDQNQYYIDHGLHGDDGVYAMWQAYQDAAVKMFDRVQGHKIRIDTQGGEWDSYVEQVTRFLQMDYYPSEKISVQNPENYCGRYQVELDGRMHSLEIKYDGKHLYCSAFWPYMKLLPTGDDKFTFSSFPIDLTFNLDGQEGGKSVDVEGKYDWEIMGQTLTMVMV